ncbi:MAG: GNAT family N-acetyltransferase [Acidobacteriota bacterium]
MPILYRRLQEGDGYAYRCIHLESLKVFPDNFGTLYQDQVNVPILLFETFIETGSKDNFMIGAFAEGELIGIAGVRREERPKTRHRGEIVQVFVKPAFHGQKIGETLVRKVIDAAFLLPGVESLELSAVADNSAARRLYEKVGFETYGIRNGYFKSGGNYTDQRFMQLSKEKYLSGDPA